MKHNQPPNRAARRHSGRFRRAGIGAAVFAAAMLALPAPFLAPPAAARDTDIWKPAAKNSAYFMVDRSGSMHYWVYDHSIDWAALYDNFMTRNDLSIKEIRAKYPDKQKNLAGGSGTSSMYVGQYIFDSYSQADGGGFRGYDIIANGPDDEHGLHYEKDRIYLVNWNIEVKVVNGVAITGDMPKSATGHRTKHWDKRVAQRTGKWEDALIAIDTKARLDENGNIVLEPGSMLSFAPDDPEHSHVLLNGKVLPLGQDLPEHKYIPLKNGTKLDNGFVGYLQSPGFVNSGYKSVPDGVEPYLGEASDKSLAATDKAREMLLAERAKMKTWNLKQWQAWADARFTADNSPDGKSTWRDWTGARTKWATTENGHTAHNVRWNYGTQESNADYKKLGSAATEWTAAAWYKFISDIDNYWATSSPNRSYFCVLLPEDKGGQQRGEFLLGRWAQAMYEKNLPEKQKWQQLAGAWEEETDGHNWLYAFVTGNYLNYVQSITLRYIDSPDLKGKTLQYPYPEAHNEANRDKNGGTVYQFGVSEITDNDSSYIPREQPQFDRYYVQDGKLKIRDDARYASMNPLFYEGWPDRQGKRVQNRFEALRSALVHTLDNYGDKMNWGFAAYPRKKAPNDRGYIHGATDKSFAGVWEDEQGNPRSTLLDLTRDPAALLKDVREKASTTGAGGGTPMTGSLQHVWYNGFHKPYTEGKLGREEDCGKYYVITLADGMASVDFNHSADDSCYGEYFGHAGDCRRKEPIVPLNAPIHPNYNGRKPPSYAKPFAQCDTGALGSAKNKGSWDALPGFQNWDCDYWRNDASQNIGHVGTLYDDVAVYMYTHSFKTGEEICNPFDTDSGKAAQCRQKLKDSQDNVKSHHISLGLVVPAMRDAAESTGGKYFVASNKDQLVAVFEDLAESMSEAASFTAPSVPADAQNSLESGEDVYMGLFMPLAEGPWAGNVKWFKRGSADNALAPNPYAFYGKDASGKYAAATNDDGEFLEDATDWWGDAAFNSKATDTNITDDGAGEVLLKAVRKNFDERQFHRRKIYTCELDDDDDDDDECELVELYKAFSDDDDDELDEDLYKKHLKVDSEAEARQVINFTYGFETDAKGEPTAARAWPLGAIIHSQPIAIDYYANAEVDEPYHRLIAAGANDGMLHVFDADSGEEVFAFIPRDILPKLKDMRGGFTDGVDGELTLYRAGDPPRQPKYLIFGERRGGGTYWCLDISMEKGTLWKDNPWQPVKDGEARWKVQWVFGHPEIAQSWSKAQTARIPVKVEKKTATVDGKTVTYDKRTYRDVVVFTAGYDAEEDNFPEPFNDQAGPEAEQNTGTPFALATASGGVNAGEIISAKWSPGAAQTDGTCEKTKFDPNRNCKYDIQNPDANEKGRALFVLDINDPTEEVKAKYHKYDMAAGKYSETETEEVVLPFILKYGETNANEGNERVRDDMKFCFPATPATVAYTDAFMDQAKGEVDTRTNVLDTVYAPDIYGNLFKARYNIAFENFGTIDEPDWRLRGEGWEVAKVFTANPGSATEPAGVEGAQVAADVGRKVFYPPTVSWGGTESFFEAANFAFYDDEAHTAEDFRNRNGIASVFFGTGDREHPTYTMVSNRIYGVYDDSSMYVRKANGTKQEISSVSFAPYDERDLLNLTCDELGSEFDNPSYLWSDNNADAMTDFNSWLQATFKRDWNGDGEVNESDAASLEAVVTELTEGGYKNDFCEWVEERQPWKYKGEEGASQLTTDCASGSLAREYLAKQYLGETLTDDARDRYEEKLAELEQGGARNSSGKRQGTENDRKGWFIKLDEQGYGGACGHMTTPSTGYDPERDNHRGEQVLAPLTLYYGTLYLTSYQSDLSDPCKTGSNAFTYAIDYKTGKAPYNYHIGDSGLNMIDRYYKYEGILGLPSGVTFIFDGDTVVPVAQLGGNKLAGFSEVCPPGEENCEDKAPGLGGVSTPSPGLELYYWRDSNSQSPDDLNGIEGGGNNGGNP